LYKYRNADSINIDALLSAKDGKYGRLINKVNDNSDNGAVKRVFPAGLYFNYNSEIAFRAGADFAAITHTDPTGYLAAGCYCAIMAELISGESLENAINISMRILKDYEGHEQTLETLDSALNLIGDDAVSPRAAIESIGYGRSADEALAIALFCVSLHSEDYANAIRLATNHDGESDVCGALCGGIFGAYRGIGAIPKRWVKKIQYYNMLWDVEEELYGVTVFREPGERLAGGAKAGNADWMKEKPDAQNEASDPFKFE